MRRLRWTGSSWNRRGTRSGVCCADGGTCGRRTAPAGMGDFAGARVRSGKAAVAKDAAIWREAWKLPANLRRLSPGAPVVAGTATPHDVERIAFATALGIFYTNDGDAAVGGVADQVLPAASVDAAETEIVRPYGHGLVTVEPAPSSALAFPGAKAGDTAADFHFGDAIDFDFDGTLTVAAAPSDIGGAGLLPAPLGEGAEGGDY